jgi:hypothetical protein
LIRIGGAFQGGAADRTSRADFKAFEGRFGTLPILANALTSFVNDGVTIDASALRGVGGTAVIWSDKTTTMLGALRADGQKAGGYAEVSGKETLRYVDLSRIDTGIGGRLLLDPKNIVIGDFAQSSSWQYAAVMGSDIFRAVPGAGNVDDGDYFGGAVALNADGDLLAVGAIGDGGADNIAPKGAVRLFKFTDTSFSGGSLAGIIGHGYTGAGNINLSSSLDTGDEFGISVALNAAGDRLAVGAHRDSGFGNLVLGSGSVRLFTFDNRSFGGGVHAGTIGQGYTGAGNFNLGALAGIGLGADGFGRAVALNGAGDRLAVGAPSDDGFGNTVPDTGAVHLFSLSNTGPVSPTYVGSMGRNYAGSNDIDVGVSVEANDGFGTSVALNAAGDRLAIGSPNDDGVGNSGTNLGAVRLYSFSGSSFASGSLVGTLAKGTLGAGGLDLSGLQDNESFGASLALNAAGNRLVVGANARVQLFKADEPTDFGDLSFASLLGRDATGATDLDPGSAITSNSQFGHAVALNGAGNLLAVGSPSNRGAANSASAGFGAVNLYRLGDRGFFDARLAGTLGVGYANGFNIDLGTDLKHGSHFGVSVALNGAGDRLAVGAPLENSFDDLVSSTGSVRLFTFANSHFGGGELVGTIGRGYSGNGNLDLGSLLNVNVQFGSSVALNAAGDRLAVGAIRDGGPQEWADDGGAVHLFTFTNTRFGGAAHASTIGRGYRGPNDIDLGLALGNDNFGSSVSLNAAGNRLAVGAVYDRGANRSEFAAGAVRLFTFTNNSFGGGAHAGTIGLGFPPSWSNSRLPGDFDLTTLDQYDNFGSSVALNGEGDRLAVGARSDSGSTNSVGYAGSVRLFAFDNNSFAQTRLIGTIGQGYSGPQDVNLSDLEEGDGFGFALALNAAGDRLAVGVNADDGFSNLAQDSGSVRLFTFDDNDFSNGTQVGTIGTGYTGAKDVDVANRLVSYDISVALNAAGDRLAVGGGGLPGADPNGGAVRLFSFGDTRFSGGRLQGLIGRGFGGTENIDLSAQLASGDDFGASVALNADGDRLAVGAPKDDGLANTTADSGAVRLFTFANTRFGGGVLVGTIGRGYTGTGNFDLGSQLESDDYFGQSVALNAAGDGLAVGATGDDGFGNGTIDSGSVRLFNFQTTRFVSPSLVATIGRGYAGALDLDLGVSLASEDGFGTSVAFNGLGDRLAVGAVGDDGADNSLIDSGAVWLFNTTSILSNRASLLGRIGRGYSGSNSIDLGSAVREGDKFGSSVALNESGNRLAVGAPGYDGFANSIEDSGSVALFGFANNSFSLGGRLSMIASGWTGANNFNLELEESDNFGQAVALSANGSRLAAVGLYGGVKLFDYVGASSGGMTSAGTVDISSLFPNVFSIHAIAMNGSGDRLALGTSDANRVFLMNRTGGSQALSSLAFVDNATGTSNISAANLASFLSTGQSISLEASNDITLQSALTVNRPDGNGGGLTLRAGRSILLNADITTDNGNLTLEANSGGSDLVTVNANRDPGAAEITMATGMSINAGSGGAVSMRLFPGTGLTTPTSGDITLGSITANTIAISNAGPTDGSDIIVRSGSIFRAFIPSGSSGVRRLIDIRAETGTFINNAGTGLFDLSNAPSRTYGVFSDAPATTLEGVTGYLKRYNVADAAAFAALNTTGNLFAYRIAPVLTVTANDASRHYGTWNPIFNTTITGFIDGDTAADLFGIASLTNSSVGSTRVGSSTIEARLGSLESPQGYKLVMANGTLSITPRPITVTATAASRAYGEPTGLPYTVGGMGLVYNDDLIDTLATTATAASGVGTYAITQGTLVANSNYVITDFTGANLTITPRPITVTANPVSRNYGDATVPIFTYTVGGLGLVNNDSLFGSLRSIANQSSSVGHYAITQGTLQAGSNYAITSYTGANLTVTPRPITVTANGLSRVYGYANPVLTYVVGGQGLVNNDSLSGALATGASTTSPVGNHAITLGTLANSNYQISYTGANLTITPRPITVMADSSQSRFYGSANPQMTYTVGGDGLVNGDRLTGALTSAANSTSAIGLYEITQGTLGNSNYEITYNGQLLRVAPRPITVTANALSRFFGNENPELTYNVGGLGLVNNDGLSGRLSTSSDRFTNIGAGLITQGTLAANSNYALTYVGANLTITPRPVSIVASGATRQYGDPNPLSYSTGGLGFVAWDPAQGALGTSANAFSNVGSYAITQGTLRFSSNYELTSFTGATLTIVPRELTVTALGTSRIYGDPNRLSFEVGGRGLVNGDTLSGALTSAANERSNVGSYAISNTLSASSNYVITNFFGGNTLIVSPRPIEVIANSDTKIAGTPDPAFTVTSLLTGLGLVNGDTLAAGQLSRDPGELPGSYTIRQGSLGNPNYAIIFRPGLLRIDQVRLPPAATGASTPPPAAQGPSGGGPVNSGTRSVTAVDYFEAFAFGFNAADSLTSDSDPDEQKVIEDVTNVFVDTVKNAGNRLGLWSW